MCYSKFITTFAVVFNLSFFPFSNTAQTGNDNDKHDDWFQIGQTWYLGGDILRTVKAAVLTSVKTKRNVFNNRGLQVF